MIDIPITSFEAMIVGIVSSVVVGIGIAVYFHKIENNRRIKEKERDDAIFRTKERKCIEELLRGIGKGWTSRTDKALSSIAGMSESEFLKFVYNHEAEIERNIEDKKGRVWYKLKNSKEFTEKYESKE